MIWADERNKPIIKVATFNLRHHADRWTERFPLVVKTLIEADADLIGLQEVSLKLGVKNQAEIIANAIREQQGEECYQVYFRACRGTQQNNEGIAILSRIPVLAVESIDLPGIWRVAIRVEVESGGKPMQFVNTHLHHEPVFDEIARYPQAEQLLFWAKESGIPSIIVGDFNARPESTTIQLMKKQYCSAYEQIHGAEPEHTWPTPLVSGVSAEEIGMIDYIFYPETDFLVQQCELIGTDADSRDSTLFPSDHFGIQAGFHLQ